MLLAVLHLTFAVIIAGLALIWYPLEPGLHRASVLVEQVPLAAYVLLTVLHLTFAVIIAGLALIWYPLEAGLHRTSALVEQVPLAAYVLLAVLHLTFAVIIVSLVLIWYPLEPGLHRTIWSEQVPLATYVLLPRDCLALWIIERLAVDGLPTVGSHRLDDYVWLALRFQFAGIFVKETFWTVNRLFAENLVTVLVVIIFLSVKRQPAKMHRTGRRIEIAIIIADFLRTVLHLTVRSVIAGFVLICHPLQTGLHCARVFVEQVPLAVDALLTVLHLPIWCVIAGLLLIFNPLQTGLHCARVFVEQVPFAVDALLTVLHLPVWSVVAGFVLICHPLKTGPHWTVRSEQIPFAVDLPLTCYCRSIDVILVS